jgi:FHS family L-fucose permease-like MFS transporter
VGAVVTPFIGAAFILSALEYSREQLTTMTPTETAMYRTAVVSTVRMPYLVIAGVFLAYAAVIFLSHLPEVGATDGAVEQESTREELRDIWRYGHLVKGVIAQFFYVGAQIGVGSFVIRLAQHSIPGMLQKDASFYLKLHLIGFMLGRFSGSYIMKRVPAARLLSLFALSTLIGLLVVLLGSGVAPLWAVVLIGFFHSIMFPTIFALSIKQLGRYTKLGSSLLVASILGGAICPAIMGFISDHSNIRVAFIVPLICQAYVLYFAVRGYRPVLVAGSRAAELSTVK